MYREVSLHDLKLKFLVYENEMTQIISNLARVGLTI